MTWVYRCDTEISFGRGIVEDARAVLRTRGGVPALLVRGSGALERSGVLPKVRRSLGPDLGGEATVAAPATAEAIQAVVDAACKAGTRGILAVGGGSVLDAAKAAALSLSHALPLADLLGGARDETPRAVPLVAVPSTAGTGAEVLPWAEIWDPKAGTGATLEDRRMSPSAALVDPDLLEGTPRELAAATGLDALVQNVESCWSRRAVTISRAFAVAGARRAAAYLVAAASGNKPAREEMAAASLFGGLALLGTRATVCHGIARPISVRWGVPHGFAAAIALPAFLRRHAGKFERDAELYAALGAQNAEGAAKEVERLIRAVGAPARLGDVGIRRPDVEGIVAEALAAERAETTPVPPTAEGLREALEAIL